MTQKRAPQTGTLESSAAIQIDMHAETSGSGQITRDGVAITQDVRRPQTADLICGARLYHSGDRQLYTITAVGSDGFKISRLSDGTTHDATLKQLKLCTYLITERVEGDK